MFAINQAWLDLALTGIDLLRRNPATRRATSMPTSKNPPRLSPKPRLITHERPRLGLALATPPIGLQVGSQLVRGPPDPITERPPAVPS